MTHELILTSVVRGLNPNDRGFCPVAADSEITPRVVQHLTALSGYRYLIEDSGELSPQSPVAYSHLVLPGELEHVLSRVAGIGTDYQGQPNVLAHHIVLEGTECPPESPAWLLALPGFHLSEWKGPPVQFAQGRPIPTLTNPLSLTRRQHIARQHRWIDPPKMLPTGSADIESTAYFAPLQSNDEQIALTAPPTSPCPVWQELTGDAGWGGVLAETAFTGQPVVLIYNPEQNILPLYVEALALLPEHFAWRTTFCTYFTGLPDEIPCQWKGVIAGSAEVKPLVRDLNNLVLDLTIPMGDAPLQRYVDFARYGQERMLPQDIEEHARLMATVNEDTKSFSNTDDPKTDKLLTPPSPALVSLTLPSTPAPPKIQPPPKRVGQFETLLRRSSRLQFYLLYSIMFLLVLFLLVLAIDQAGDFGIVRAIQNRNQQTVPVPPDMPEVDPPPATISELDDDIETDIAQIEADAFAEPESPQKIFNENREKQRDILLQFLERFDVPEFLALNFPDVHDHQDNVPERKTFDELSSLQPFGAALELRFVPLFELSAMRVETSLLVDMLPDLVWRVSAVDNETELATPMFLFRLTESGLEMDWQLEGLNNQYLYDTVLSSLGFLELSVADVPESATLIPLFVPVETMPMKVSDLANLAEQELPEHIIALPFASELWQEIFSTMRPSFTLRFEVRAEPETDWVRLVLPSESELHAEVRTAQEARRPTESGDTFESITVTFLAEVSLEEILWKGDGYAVRLLLEQDGIAILKESLERQIGQLDAQIFDGDQSVRQERDGHRAELRTLDFRLRETESILERLPAAYREISENESGRFHYSVFLESESTNRRLLIFRTVP